jgi:ABC-type transport system involved in cytochrome bd biosynthesis fused ATPase/permease subunit
MQVHRRLLPLIGIAPWPVVGTAAVGLLVTASYVAQGLLLAHLLAGVFAGRPVDLVPMAGLLAFILARAVLIRVRQSLQAVTAHTVKLRLRRRLYDKLRALGPAHLSTERTGQVQAVLVDGVEGLEAYSSTYLPQLLVCLLGPIPLLGWIAFADLPVAGAIALCVIAVPLLPRLWERLLHDRGGEHWAAYARLSAEYVDAMQGLATLKAFRAAGRRRDQLDGEANLLYRATMRQLRVSLMDSGLVAVATFAGTSLAAVLGALALLDGRLMPEQLFAVLLLSRECFRPFAQLSAYWHAGFLGISAADDIADMLAAQPSLGTATVGTACPAGNDIVFRDVSFRYRPDLPPAVDRVSFEVSQGGTLAIVGPSGSGKSTLVALLLGALRPSHGQVVLGGRPIEQLGRDDVLGRIAVVWQDTYLFHGTVADNIRLGAPDATDAQLRAAARAAGAEEFVDALSAGFETVVGERGSTLSGGQRQRIAIARAFLKDAPLLLLDEATSALDTESEEAIREALGHLMNRRTVVAIAHRLSTVRNFDRIVVLQTGRVAQDGPPDVLMRREGLYRQLVQREMSRLTQQAA